MGDASGEWHGLRVVCLGCVPRFLIQEVTTSLADGWQNVPRHPVLKLERVGLVRADDRLEEAALGDEIEHGVLVAPLLRTAIGLSEDISEARCAVRL